MKKLLCTAAALAAFSTGAQAADSQGLYQTLYFVPCANYAEHRKEAMGTGNNALDQVYIAGWLSGYNYLTPNTYDILPSHDLPGVMKWLDEFCKKNPSLSVDAGLLQLTDELYPNRVKDFVRPEAHKLQDATGTASKLGKEQSKFTLPKREKEAAPAKPEKKAK